MSFLAPACQLKEHIPLGTHTGIDQITPQRLKAYYSQYYTPANTRLIIAGNFNLDQLRRRIKTQFQTWNTPGKSETYYFPEPNPLKDSVQAAAFIHPNIRSQISLTLVQPFVRHSDTPARRKEQLLLAIANQTLQYRLQTRTETSDDGLRFPEVLTTNQNNCAITHQLSVHTPPGQWTAGLELLEKERRRALQHGFTSQEIQRQYDRLVNDAKRRVTAESQKTNQSYVDEALWVFNEQLTPTSAHDDLVLLESLKPAVTVDHVAAVFQHYWSSPAPKILLSDAIGMKNIQQMLLDTYHVSTLQPLSQLAQAEQQAFYYQDFGPKAIPKQLQPTSYGNIHRYLFDNGVALSVKPTQLEPGMVHLSIRLGHGISGLSPAHAALIEVFNSGFLAGGLEQHSLEQLRHIFYGRTLGANLAFQDDAIQGTYLIANDDLLDQLKILAAYLTAPGYRESGMAFSRAVLENAFRTSQESPESVLAMNLDAVLHHQDPRWSFPDKKQLDAIKLADLKTIITLIRSHGPIEIGVVGDITPQQAIDRVGQTFGALNIDVVPPAISEQQTTLFFGGRQTRLFHQGDQQTALVSTIYPLPKANQQKASMTFPVLREVIQLKLTEIIRENEGLAYSPQAQSTQSRVFQNFNYLGLHSNTQVNKVDAVQTTYRRIIREIQNKGVTQDEFSRAISPIRAALEQRETHNDYWQDLTAIAFSYPEEVVLAGQMDQQLQRIQPGDIQALAQQIKLSDAIEILILPQGTPQ
ncbi:M16 family metallopeptidase [Photobacterium sp. TY1-4]|uniref:M16 family metallopeptidase n=1 Tax=Photobacterium sp. TY1-4 TaxID=2899122 RepID=UPI0021C09055|nr:insulinase family protein [Photobacterium sp. TY1-4]UXI04007.1 insulinase family protein [Photobacterium sp. TY1-4]